MGSGQQQLINAIMNKAQPPQGMGNTSTIVIGTLASFDPSTGENTVVVNGAQLTNLAILISGAETVMTPGTTVWLLVIGNTYAIIGQVATPDSPAFGRASTATFGFAFEYSWGAWTASSTEVDILYAAIPVPNWANTMTFFAAVEHSFTASADSNILCQVRTNGNVSGEITDFGPSGHLVRTAKFQSGVQTGLTPGSTVYCTGQFRCPVNGTLSASIVSGVAMFTRT